MVSKDQLASIRHRTSPIFDVCIAQEVTQCKLVLSGGNNYLISNCIYILVSIILNTDSLAWLKHSLLDNNNMQIVYKKRYDLIGE